MGAVFWALDTREAFRSEDPSCHFKKACRLQKEVVTAAVKAAHTESHSAEDSQSGPVSLSGDHLCFWGQKEVQRTCPWTARDVEKECAPVPEGLRSFQGLCVESKACGRMEATLPYLCIFLLPSPRVLRSALLLVKWRQLGGPRRTHTVPILLPREFILV